MLNIITIDTLPITFLITLVLFGVTMGGVIRNVHRGGLGFRVALILAITLAFALAVGIVISVRPLEFGVAFAFGLILVVFVFSLYVVTARHRRFISKSNYATTLDILKNIVIDQVSFLIYRILLIDSDRTSVGLNIDRSFRTIIDFSLITFVKFAPQSTFRISILEANEDGSFTVLSTSNIPIAKIDLMTKTFNWYQGIGCAGKAATSENGYILCSNLRDPQQTKDSGWVSIVGDEVEQGGILCIRIPFPKDYALVDRDKKPCLGVLCISCSTPNHLTIDYLGLIDQSFLRAISFMMLAKTLYSVAIR